MFSNILRFLHGLLIERLMSLTGGKSKHKTKTNNYLTIFNNLLSQRTVPWDWTIWPLNFIEKAVWRVEQWRFFLSFEHFFYNICLVIHPCPFSFRDQIAKLCKFCLPETTLSYALYIDKLYTQIVNDNRLHNRIEPFAALYWALGIALAHRLQ